MIRFYRIFLIFFSLHLPVMATPKETAAVLFQGKTAEFKNPAGGKVFNSEMPKSFLVSTGQAAVRPLSASEAMVMDLSIPGGGHFYSGNYLEGTFWLVAKSLGAFGIYYTNHRYQEEKQGQDKFNSDPSAANDQNRKTSRSVMNLWFAIFGEVALYSVSLYRALDRVDLYNQRFLPHFELTWQEDISLAGTKHRLQSTPYFEFSWHTRF